MVMRALIWRTVALGPAGIWRLLREVAMGADAVDATAFYAATLPGDKK